MKEVQSYGKRKLDDKRSILLFFWVCWLAYLSVYFGRLNLAASLSDMTMNHGFAKSDLGGIVAIFHLAYGTGQLFAGILGDRISPKWLVFIGLFASSVINLLFAFQQNTTPMMVLWFLNGAFQSLTWSPIIKLCTDRLTEQQCRKTCVDLCTTGPVGMLGTYGLCALLLQWFSWRASFVVGFVILLASSVLWFVAIGKLERYADKHGVCSESAQIVQHGTEKHKGKLVPLVLTSGLIVVVLATLVNGMLKDGITTWVPTFLVETFQLDASISTGITTLLPLVNLAGVYLARFCNQRVFRNELTTTCVFFGVTALAVLGNAFVGNSSMLLTISLLAVSTSAMVGVNTLLTGLVPLSYQSSGRVSLVTGLVNSAAHLGGAIASYLFGAIAEQWGWYVNCIAWVAFAAAGAALCFVGIKRWKQFSQPEESRQVALL